MSDWAGTGTAVGASGDAYMSIPAADAWISSHVVLHTQWDVATDAQKGAALVEASDAIDSLPLKGCKYSDNQTQERAFPRYPDRAGQAIGGDETNFQSDIDYSDVPQEILDACCLEALAIMQWGASWRRMNQEQGVKQVQLGSGSGLSETYDSCSRLLSKKATAKMRDWIAGVVEAV